MTTPQADRPSTFTILTGLSFVSAPVFLLLAWVFMWPLDGRNEPGAAWTLAHLSWCAAFLLLSLVCMELRRTIASSTSAGRSTPADVLTGVALFGLAAATAQMIVDLVAGFRASDRAEMNHLIGEMTDLPGVEFLLYTASPILVFSGLLGLFVIMAARRLTHPAAPVLVMLGAFVLAAAENLTFLGVALLWLAMAPRGTWILRGAGTPSNRDVPTS